MVVINVFGVDDFFWKRVTDQQLQQDASYKQKIVFLFLHWREWNKPIPCQLIDYKKIMNKVQRSFPVQPPRVGFHNSGMTGHPRNVVGIFEEKKFRIAWNELVENGSIIQQEETPNDRLLTRHRLNKSPLASRRHRYPYGKFYCHDDVMDDVEMDNDEMDDDVIDDVEMQVDGGTIVPDMAPPDPIVAREADNEDMAPPDPIVATEADNEDMSPAAGSAPEDAEEDPSVHLEDTVADDIREDHEMAPANDNNIDGSSVHSQENPDNNNDDDDYIDSDDDDDDESLPGLEDRHYFPEDDDDDSVFAPEAEDHDEYQEMEDQRHTEQRAPEEARIPAARHASAAVPIVPHEATATALEDNDDVTLEEDEEFKGPKYMGLCPNKLGIGQELLNKFRSANPSFKPKVRDRSRSQAVHNAHVLYRYADMRIFFKLSERRGYQHTYVVDFEKLERTTNQDRHKFSPIQIKCIEYILDYKNLKAADPNSIDVEIHHLAMRSLGGGNDPDNLIALEIVKHIKIHLAYAMLFENYQILLAASFMMNQGGAEGRHDVDVQGKLLDEIQDLFGNDGAITDIATIRYKLSKKLVDAHQRDKAKQPLNEEQAAIITNYRSMRKGMEDYRLRRHDMANKLATGNLDTIETEKDFKMLQHLVAHGSFWHTNFLRTETFYPNRIQSAHPNRFTNPRPGSYATPIQGVCATAIETMGSLQSCYVCFWRMYNIPDLREQADEHFRAKPKGMKGRPCAETREYRNGKRLVYSAQGGCKKCGVWVCLHCWPNFYCRDANKYLDFKSSVFGFTLMGQKLHFAGKCTNCNKDKYAYKRSNAVRRHCVACKPTNSQLLDYGEDVVSRRGESVGEFKVIGCKCLLNCDCIE